MATVGSAIVAIIWKQLFLRSSAIVCDLRSEIYDRLRSSAIIWKPALRAAACKDRELAVNDQSGESLISGPKILFGALFSKIIFKSSSDFLILRDSQKFENAVKVRFFGQLKIQNNVRERSTAKCLK